MNRRNRFDSTIKNFGPDLLSEGKTIRIKAHGYSMYPSIKPGSIIIIDPIARKGNPVCGEIIAIRRENGLVAHRLIKIVIKDGVRYYIARGDSNSAADPPITLDKIAGRVVKAEPSGENPVPADIRINKRPGFFINRLRVIFIILKSRLKALR